MARCTRLTSGHFTYRPSLTLSQGNQHKARKRFRQTVRRHLHEGITGADFMTLTELARTGNRLLYRLRRLFAAPYDFATGTYAIEKGAYLLLMFLRFGIRITLFVAIAVGIVVGMHAAMGDPMPLENGVRQVVTSRWFQISVGLIASIHLRLIWYRLSEMTTDE